MAVLILVSGALSDCKLLRDNPLVPELAKHFTVYSYDRRGRGDSTDIKRYVVHREIEDIDALIAYAGKPAYVRRVVGCRVVNASVAPIGTPPD